MSQLYPAVITQRRTRVSRISFLSQGYRSYSSHNQSVQKVSGLAGCLLQHAEFFVIKHPCCRLDYTGVRPLRALIPWHTLSGASTAGPALPCQSEALFSGALILFANMHLVLSWTFACAALENCNHGSLHYWFNNFSTEHNISPNWSAGSRFVCLGLCLLCFEFTPLLLIQCELEFRTQGQYL